MPARTGEHLLGSWLAHARRTLTKSQRREILGAFSIHGLPLQLRLSFEEARHWTSYARETTVDPTVPGLIRRLLSRLSDQGDHGPVMVSSSLGYLAAARDGLSDDELLELLSRDEIVRAEFRNRSPKSPRLSGELPVIAWSRLYFDLEPYLAERTSGGALLLGFYHRQLAEVIAQEYLSGHQADACHRHLASYFAEQELEIPTRNGTRANLRKLTELAYQQVLGRLWQDAYETLTDIRILQRQVTDMGVQERSGPNVKPVRTYTGVLSLLDDLALAVERWPSGDSRVLSPLRDCLALSTHVLLRDPSELRAQLLGRLESSRAEVGVLSDRVRAHLAEPWLRPLSATLPGPGGGLLRTLTGWAGHVEVLAITPDGRLAVSGALHGRLDVWDLDSQAHLHDLHRFENAITALAIDPDGRRVIVGAGGGALAVWELESGLQPYGLAPHADTIAAVAVSADGRLGISASPEYFDSYSNGAARSLTRVWNLATGNVLETFERYAPRGRTVAVRADGHRVITALEDNALEVWDTEHRRRLQLLRGHTTYIRSVAIASNGRFAVSGAGEEWFSIREGNSEPLEEKCAVRLWDLESGTCLAVLRGHSGTVHSVAIDADGRLAVSGSSDHTVRVWDLRTQTEQNVFTEHAGEVQAVALTPDGRRAISASHDHTMKVWDPSPRPTSRQRQSHRSAVTAVAVSPSGQQAASASKDGELMVWDLTNGTCIRTLPEQKGEARAVAFSHDGRYIVSGGTGIPVREWN